MTERSDPPADGRSAQAFPSTRWSRILGTGSQSGTLPDVESLAKAYWRPVYGYVRSRFSKTDDEAVDCTQDFFLWMIERASSAAPIRSAAGFAAFSRCRCATS